MKEVEVKFVNRRQSLARVEVNVLWTFYQSQTNGAKGVTQGNLAGTKTVLSAQLTNLYRLGVGRHKYSIMVRNGRLFSTFFIAFDSKSRARA